MLKDKDPMAVVDRRYDFVLLFDVLDVATRTGIPDYLRPTHPGNPFGAL